MPVKLDGKYYYRYPGGERSMNCFTITKQFGPNIFGAIYNSGEGHLYLFDSDGNYLGYEFGAAVDPKTVKWKLDLDVGARFKAVYLDGSVDYAWNGSSAISKHSGVNFYLIMTDGDPKTVRTITTSEFKSQYGK